MIYFNITVIIVCVTVLIALIIETIKKQNKYKEKIEQENFNICIGNNDDPGWSKEKTKEIESFIIKNAKKKEK